MTWASVVFGIAVAIVAILVARTVAKLNQRGDTLTGTKAAVLLVLLVVVPLLWDPRTTQSFNLAKFTATVVGAIVIAGVWVVEGVRGGSSFQWRNGLHWPVLALVGWTAIATAASISPRMSVLGAIGTNDGLLAACAFAILFFAVAQTVRMDDVRAVLAVLFFGAGGLSALYGLIQIHDRLRPEDRWDWIRHFGGGGTESFSAGGIFTTFGNPNHVGAFLAMLVPIGVAMVALQRSRRVRMLVLAIAAALVLELVQTGSMGALIAISLSLGVTTVLLFWTKIWGRRPKTSAPMGAAVAVVVIAALALTPQITTKLSSNLGLGETAALRLGFWEAGVGMANDRPLLGHGPDMFPDRLARYQDADMARRYGRHSVSDGAHNLFVGQMANTGYLGLILLLSVLVYAAMRTVASLRRLRQIELEGREDEALLAHDARLCLIGVVGGLVAFLSQASFNITQVGLSFLFWVLLGLLCVVSMGAGVPTSLRARALVGHPAAPARSMPGLDPQAQTRRSARRRTTRGFDPAVGAVAVMSCIGVALAVSAATRPLRADHNVWAARVDQAFIGESPPNEAARLSRRATTRLGNAVDLNPWEPSYLATMGDSLYAGASKLADQSPAQTAALRGARSHYERAIELRPHSAFLLEKYTTILLTIYKIDPTAGEARAAAIAALQRAVRSDPHAVALRQRLRQVYSS